MTTLYVDRRATEAKLDAGAIAFYAGGERIGTIPMASLTRVVIYGGLVVDSSLLGKLGQENIGIIILSGYKNEPVLFVPRAHNDASRRLQQALAVTDKAFSLRCARELVTLKIHKQQEHLVEELQRGHSRPLDLQQPIREMTAILEHIESHKSSAALLGAEGAAANAYFQGLATVLPASLQFTGRNHRPPKDPFNVVLSLCYTLLYAETQLLIHAAGLDPFLGVYHTLAFGRASFACDVMEPLRPSVDRFAIKAFRERLLRVEDFSKTNGGCLMGKAGRSRLYPAWESFVETLRPEISQLISWFSSRFQQSFSS